MADSYRGLTVKIGGDTTGLQDALKAATAAAASTQSQLRRIGTAMRLDPSSVDNLQAKMRLVGDRATDLAAKLSTMRQAVAQLDAKGVGRLAAETQNVGLRAERARESYNRLTAELASAYNQIKKTTGLDPRGNMGEKQLAQLSESARKAYEDLKSLKGIDLSHEVNAQDAVQAMRELGIVSDETASDVRRLGDAWGAARSELDTASEVAQYRDLQVEIRRTESELSSMAAETTKLARMNVNAEQFASLNEQLKAADSAAEQLAAQMRQADAALRLDPSDIGAAELKIRAMAEQIQVAQAKAQLLSEKLRAFEDAGIDRASEGMGNAAMEAERTAQAYTDVSRRAAEAAGALEDLRRQQQAVADTKGTESDEYRRLGTQIREADAALSALNDEARESRSAFETATQVGQYREVQAQLTETRTQAKALNDELRQMGKSGFKMGWGDLREVGQTLSMSVTPAILGVGYSAITSADTLDSAFRDMKKTVDGTDEQFAKLREKAIEFSTTHVTSADQILEIQALGGQMGVATGDLESFAEVISNLDIATDINAEDAATQLGQLANITHMTSDEYSRFGDALVRLGNNAPSQESAIMDVASRIGSMASIVGMSVPDILAWSNAIASTGQQSEAAGTAISNTMSDIETAVAGGGDSLQAFAKVSGMSAQQFAETWNTNPTAAMKAFIQGLANVEASGGSADATLQELGITGVRQKQALMGLTQTIGGLDDSLQMSNDAWNGVSDQWGAAGDAAREAQQKSEGFSGALGKLRNIASAFASELGEAAAPAIEGLADVLSKASAAFQSFPGPVKTGIVAVAGLTAVAGPALSAVGFLGQGFSALKGKANPAVRSLAEMAVEAVNTGSSLSEVAAASSSTANAAKKLTVAQRAGNVAMKAGSVAAGVAKAGLAALAVGGVIFLISKWQEYEAHQKLVADATKSFGDIALDAQRGAQSAAQGIGEISVSAEETTKKLAELNQNSANAMRDFYGQSATLDEYVDTINRLAGQSELSATDQERLKNAVQGYNEITGDSVEVTDAARGALSKSTEEINKNADAWKRNAEMQVYQDKIKEYTRQRVDAEQQLATARADAAEKTQKYNEENQKLSDYLEAHKGEDMGKLSQTQEYLDLADNAGKAKRAMDEANGAVNELQGDIDGANKSIDQMTASQTALTDAVRPFREQLQGWGDSAQQAAGSMGMTLDQLAVKLQESGVSLDTLKSISAEDFAQIAEDCSGNVDVMAGVLTGFATEASQKGMAAALGLADGMSQGQAQAVWAATQIGNMTLDQFKGQVDAFGLAGADQITAYAQSIAAGDTTDVAALKALQATQGLDAYLGRFGISGQQGIDAFVAAINGGDTWSVAALKALQASQGLESYLGQFGISGQQAIDAFINAINSGDSWSSAVQKAQQATQGLDSQQGADSQAGANAVNSFNAGAGGIDTYGAGANSGRGFASGLGSAGGAAYGSGQAVGQAGANGARSVDLAGIGASAGNAFLSAVRSKLGDAIAAARSAAATIEGIGGGFSIGGGGGGGGRGGGGSFATGGIRLNAAGGITPRMHAGGAIARRAVPLDIVGEDGAEAIVPLTNRKYSQPFADLIADGVNRRLGQTIAEGADRVAMAALADEYESHAARTAADAVSVTVAVDNDAIAAAVAKAVSMALDAQPRQNVVTVNTQNKVVRSDADLYTAAPIINRDAENIARGLML